MIEGMKVKVYGKESMEKGFAVLEPELGAVKIVFPNKVIVVTSNQKVTEYEQLPLPTEKNKEKK